MKTSKVLKAAIAVGVVANLALGATAANATTTYSAPLMSGTTLNDNVAAPVAFYNGKIITMTGDTVSLFATDPSSASTVDLLSTVNSGANAGRYALEYNYGLDKPFTDTQFNGKAWLFVDDSLENNWDLFYTDGTLAGSGVAELDLRDYWEQEIAANADGVYFWNEDNLGHEDLYWFNGTTVALLGVTDASRSSYPFAIRNFQGKISFLVANYADAETIQGYVLGNASSTQVGVIPNMDPNNNWDWDYLNFSGQNASAAYLGLSENNNEYSLWRTTAYNAPYTVLVDNDIYGSEGVFFNGKYYFSGLSTDPSQPNGHSTLARTDGTTVEAVHGADLSYPEGFTVVGNKMYFAAYEETYNIRSLYSLDTAYNLDIVAEDWEFDGYDWAVGAGANGAFFFEAIDAEHGSELWVDDAEGTRLALDLNVGTANGYPHNFSTDGNLVCFSATVIGDASVALQDDLYCVETAMLASTGVDASGIGAAAALMLIAGVGTAVVARRRSAIA
jgi:ELWxxDGT repeat protein